MSSVTDTEVDIRAIKERYRWFYVGKRREIYMISIRYRKCIPSISSIYIVYTSIWYYILLYTLFFLGGMGRKWSHLSNWNFGRSDWLRSLRQQYFNFHKSQGLHGVAEKIRKNHEFLRPKMFSQSWFIQLFLNIANYRFESLSCTWENL